MIATRDEFEKAFWEINTDAAYLYDLDQAKETVEGIGPLSGRILEIGCGDGRLLTYFYTAVGIDISSVNVQRCRAANLAVYENDGRTIPFADESFDSIYCVTVFQHLPSEGVWAYLREAVRVLRPDGIFRFQFVNQEPFGQQGDMAFNHRPGNILQSVTDAGLTPVAIEMGLVNPNWTWLTVKKESNG